MVCLGMPTPTLQAQLLDLDPPAAEVLGEQTGAMALRDLLLAQSERLEARDDAGAPVRAELRRLSAALLESSRAVPVLLGRTMAARLPELDALASDPRLDAVDRSLVLADLRRARSQIPVSTDQLDRAMRSALARLAHVSGRTSGRTPSGPGWVLNVRADVSGAPTLERAIELLVSLSDDDEYRLACERLASVAGAAQGRPAYAPAGDRLAQRVRLASVLIDSPPGWVSQEQRQQGGAGIARACALVMDPATRRVGADLLDRYAGLARLLALGDALDTTNDTRALLAKLAASIEGPPGLDTTEAMSRGLRLAIGDPALDRDESDLLRQLRPAWRTARREAKLQARAIVPRLAPMLDVDAPLTDPATLATLASASAPTALARTLLSLSDLLDDDESGASARPKAHGDRAKVADRVLALTSNMDDSAERARRTLELMNEDLRRASALVRAHTDADPLAKISARVYDNTLSAWADEGADLIEARAALGRAERLAQWLDAEALVAPLSAGDALVQRWAGIELSRGAVEIISAGLAEKVSVAVRLADEGDAARIDRALARLDERYLAIRLLAQLDGRLHELWSGDAKDASVLSELALGPPPEGAWLLDQRTALATLCMQGEELASATIRDDRPVASDLRKALNATAQRLMRAIEGR